MQEKTASDIREKPHTSSLLNRVEKFLFVNYFSLSNKHPANKKLDAQQCENNIFKNNFLPF